MPNPPKSVSLAVGVAVALALLRLRLVFAGPASERVDVQLGHSTTPPGVPDTQPSAVDPSRSGTEQQLPDATAEPHDAGSDRTHVQPADCTILPEAPDTQPSVVDSSASGAAQPLSAATAEPPNGPPIVDVVIYGGGSQVQRQRESAEAVSIYELDHAQNQTADLGDVIARVQGISVARTGGLGSEARFSLNGFSDEQVRLFIDGVPLELAGFAFGMTSIPVGLVDRIEVYRGVVPIRFGADALGGAVNLVTPASYAESGAAASGQIGSFGTYRGMAGLRYYKRDGGLFAAGTVFVDSTKNNYRVDVTVADAVGHLEPAIVTRFHDAYFSRGAFVDLGLLDRPWAKRLSVRLFASEYDKELQNNAVMTLPYGAVAYGESLTGATARYVQPVSNHVEVELLAGASRRVTNLSDTSTDVYDWYGRVISQRRQPGEIDGVPHDQTVWQNSALGRANASWSISPGHTARLSSSPTYVTSHGLSRVGLLPGARDPLAATKSMLRLVTGVEYQLDAAKDRVQNSIFAKHYWLHAASDQVLTGFALAPVNVTHNLFGIGDAVRLRLNEWLYAKTSYEYAARLPSAVELFGNGILVVPNGDLRPERSHNGNLGIGVDARRSPVGALSGELNGFVRSAQDLIVLLGNDKNFSYKNLLDARAVGVEGRASWTAPRRYLTFELRASRHDLWGCLAAA